MNYIELLQQHYPLLTKSEKKVADFILSLDNKIIYTTMSDIKAKTAVGDATIIRFCQKLGFSGFSDLKIEIAKEDFRQTNALKSNQIVNNVEDKIATTLSDALFKTSKLLDLTLLNKAVKLITEARNIYIFGVGLSGNSCADLESLFLRVGVQSKSVVDPHYQAQIASLLTADDLIIAFSLSGKTKDTYDSLVIGKKRQAKIVAITNSLFSPIAQISDVVLQTAIEEFLNGGSIAGKISQLYVCGVLINAYEEINQIDSIALRERVLRSIIDKSLD